MGINANINGNIRLRVGFVPQYQAIYNSFTTKPSAAVAFEQNEMVKEWLKNGSFYKPDRIIVLAGHTNSGGESQLDWRYGGIYNVSLINSPVYTAFEGFANPTLTSHIDTNYNPATDGINYSQNDAAIGIYNRSDNAVSGGNIGVFDGTGDFLINSKNAANNAAARINDSTTLTVANSNGQGMYFINRDSLNTRQLYKNKSIIANDLQVSVSFNNANIFALALNDGAGNAISHKIDQLSLIIIGGCLTQTDIDNFTNGFETYMDSNGKGVIP
jgi:hypothetical protein